MTVSEWSRFAAAQLAAISDSARLEAELLLARSLGVERSWLFAHPRDAAPEAADALLARRLRREPLGYILGYREFYGRRFTVAPGVLIPRQDTEILVEAALDVPVPVAARVLDIGTGSGILAITLQRERPSWQITAVDISSAALEVARRNAEDLEADIELVQSDLFQALPPTRFDLIVSNPPYIGRDEPLEPEVKDHEPPEALFADEDGLAIYRRIAEDALEWLQPNGWLMLEMGHRQAGIVRALFEKEGWKHRGTRPDLSGIPRVVIFQP